MTSGIQTVELSESICESESPTVPANSLPDCPEQGLGSSISVGSVRWVPWVPSGWWKLPRQGAKGQASIWQSQGLEAATNSLGPSIHGDKQDSHRLSWGLSQARSWRARTLRATTALVPTPRPANAHHIVGCTDHGKAAQPGAGLAKLKELEERQGWRDLRGP